MMKIMIKLNRLLAVATTVVVGDWAIVVRASKTKALPFESIKLFWEQHDSDQDLGLQLSMGSEPQWKKLQIRDPHGTTLLSVYTGGSLAIQGLTDFFFESGEPTFDQVPRDKILARFPAGIYTFTGVSTEGQCVQGTAHLTTHHIPHGPNITAPYEGQIVHLKQVKYVTISWQGVDLPAGIKIESYEVTVTNMINEDFAFDERFEPAARSALTPVDFLEPNVPYEVEVLAREVSGNQAITNVHFNTTLY